RWVQIRNARLDFFNKHADAAYSEGSELPYHMATENLNYEIELVVTIGKNGTNLSESEALDYVFGYAVGLDLTFVTCRERLIRNAELGPLGSLFCFTLDRRCWTHKAG
ncbi:MAG: fumarylacetoacetate hydrolase family protein, partial [SAR324 cluster bacterium]|nr:fumarylacetoacetate hydrolase family protein [SAR324 cluster bacterium]